MICRYVKVFEASVLFPHPNRMFKAPTLDLCGTRPHPPGAAAATATGHWRCGATTRWRWTWNQPKNQGKDGRNPFWPWFSLVFLVNRDGKDGRNWKNGDDHPNHIPFWGQGLLVLMGITELGECSKFVWIHLRIEDPNPAYSRKSQGQDAKTQIPIWCV